jgi:hypothetical protein
MHFAIEVISEQNFGQPSCQVFDMCHWANKLRHHSNWEWGPGWFAAQGALILTHPQHSGATVACVCPGAVDSGEGMGTATQCQVAHGRICKPLLLLDLLLCLPPLCRQQPTHAGRTDTGKEGLWDS